MQDSLSQCLTISQKTGEMQKEEYQIGQDTRKWPRDFQTISENSQSQEAIIC